MSVTATKAGFTPSWLAERARRLAGDPGEWLHRVRLCPDGRWYERIHRDADHEVWLIAWMPGQATGFHDHGDSAGAFTVAVGELEEHGRRERRRVSGGQTRSFEPGYVHDVRNASTAPAVSVHVYAPALTVMGRYDLAADGTLIPLIAESADDW